MFLVPRHDQGAGLAVHRHALGQADADPGVRDLALAALAAQLPDDLDRVHAGRVGAVAVGEQAVVGVARHRAAQPGVPAGEVTGPLPQLAEAHLLKVAQHGDGEAVVQAAHVDVVAGDPGDLERHVGGAPDGLAVLGEPRHVDGGVGVGVGGLGTAQYPDRRLAAVDGHVLRGDHYGVAAVVVD